MKHEQKPNAFTMPVRVYYEDTDAGGVVYYANYLKPARLDDQLSIGLEVEKLTRVRVVFRQHARRGDQELVTGTVEIACVDRDRLMPAPIPDFLYEKLEALK